jgi:outer membrane protein assembly factor BamB
MAKTITGYQKIYAGFLLLFAMSLFPLTAWAEALTLKWQIQLGSEITASPAIGSDGTLYIGSDRYLYAIRSDGTQKWEFEAGGNISSSPAIDAEGIIYAGSADQYLYAVNTNGSLRRRYKTEGKISFAPAIASDGTIYAVSDDQYLYVFDPDDESPLWKSDAGLNLSSYPVIGPSEIIYAGGEDGCVYSFYSGGSRKWTSCEGIDGAVVSSPALHSDGTVYAVSDNRIHAINSNGTRKWSCCDEMDGNILSSPAVDSDGVIYAGSEDNRLYAVYSNGSEAKWVFEDAEGEISSSPAIGDNGTIYAGSDDGYLYAVNRTDGTMDGSYRMNAGISASPVMGSDGTLYIGTKAGTLYAINTDSDGFKKSSSWPMFRHDPKHTARNTPRADAGSDHDVREDEEVTLDGSGSDDPAGLGITTYKWTQTGGTSVTLSDSSSAKTSFTTPNIDDVNEDEDELTMTFQLTVTNENGMTDEDTCTVTIERAGGWCFIESLK